MFYSLGNFAFGTTGRYTTEALRTSLLLRIDVGPNSIEGSEIRFLLTDNDEVRFQPRLCPRNVSERVLGALHAVVQVAEGVARLCW